MSAPLRWKDDPSFKVETGVSLADEVTAVGGYALKSMRAAVVAGGPTPKGRSGWATWGGSAVVVLVAAWMWWPVSDLQKTSALPIDVASLVVQPQMIDAAVSAPSRAVGMALEVVRDHPSAPTASPLEKPMITIEPSLSPVVQVEVGPAPSTEFDVQAPGTADAPERSSAPASDLAQQLALYRQGQSALDSGDLSAAGESFQRYLETWPNGQVRDEVLVSVLEIIIQHQQWSQVETLAGQLGAVQALSSRHNEFRRVRAEALSQLNRCPEALKLVESLSRPDSQAVKQRCRRVQP
ncbi:MAG: hypothetical protein GWP91_14865 [Rhodobacterales bacterium]|nr:hypothetical protein [Rhodobacterales bacterium]